MTFSTKDRMKFYWHIKSTEGFDLVPTFENCSVVRSVELIFGRGVKYTKKSKSLHLMNGVTVFIKSSRLVFRDDNGGNRSMPYENFIFFNCQIRLSKFLWKILTNLSFQCYVNK